LKVTVWNHRGADNGTPRGGARRLPPPASGVAHDVALNHEVELTETEDSAGAERDGLVHRDGPLVEEDGDSRRGLVCHLDAPGRLRRPAGEVPRELRGGERAIARNRSRADGAPPSRARRGNNPRVLGLTSTSTPSRAGSIRAHALSLSQTRVAPANAGISVTECESRLSSEREVMNSFASAVEQILSGAHLPLSTGTSCHDTARKEISSRRRAGIGGATAPDGAPWLTKHGRLGTPGGCEADSHRGPGRDGSLRGTHKETKKVFLMPPILHFPGKQRKDQRTGRPTP